ncbi:MAG: DNA adenine methylase, partial [Thermocrispum sp.]
EHHRYKAAIVENVPQLLKWWYFPKWIARMRALGYRHYVEPFGGSLAVLLAKPPAVMETVNDLDGALMTFWRVLRDRTDELMRVCALTPHSRAEHDASYAASAGEVETARRVWVQLTQGRGGTRRKTGWRHYLDASTSSTALPGYLAGYVYRMPPAAERLANVSLEARPALEIVDAYGRHEDALLYVDPPYLRSTRSSRQYHHEMSSEAEHRDLADALKECRAVVVLSGYPTPLYAELYADWHTTTLAGFTGQAGTRGQRTEVLWTNRPQQLGLFTTEAAS